MSAALVGIAALAIWLYLLFGRGFFWRAAERDDAFATSDEGAPGWPSVTAIVPARDEADVIAESVGSLLRQRYPGKFSVVLVDDQSTDGTGAIAKAAALDAGAAERLTVIEGSDPPAGWTGKLWAMDQGFRHVAAEAEPPDIRPLHRCRHRLRGAGRRRRGWLPAPRRAAWCSPRSW